MSSSDKLINPYALLGVKHTSSIYDLKKNYYNLSLLTHPDKGGSAEDFNIIHLAYDYIKEQLNNIRDVSYEELEDEFENFCEQQEKVKPPCFYEVVEETNDWLNKFNNAFVRESQDDYNDPLSKGYGDLLETSQIDLDYQEIEPLKCENKFTQEIIAFEEPNFLPDSMVHYPLDGKEIDDFGNLTGVLKSADYRLTHSQVENLEEKIKKIGVKEFKNYPTKKMEYTI